jgi:hypothetical protein
LTVPILNKTCSIGWKIGIGVFGTLCANALQEFVPFLRNRDLLFTHETTLNMIKVILAPIILQHTLRHPQIIGKSTSKHRPSLPRPIRPRHLRPMFAQLSPTVSLLQSKPLRPIKTHLPPKAARRCRFSFQCTSDISIVFEFLNSLLLLLNNFFLHQFACTTSLLKVH